MKIRAAVCRAFGAPLEIETLDLRTPVGREVEVALGAVAICHSDIMLADGSWGGTLPAVYGHEAAGRITALGPEVRGLATRRQGARHARAGPAGRCASCSGGHPVGCTGKHAQESPLTDASGGPVVHGLDTGGFAERALVDESQVARIPEAVPMDAASLMSCGVITGVGAVVNDARLRPGEDAVVIGAGGGGAQRRAGGEDRGRAPGRRRRHERGKARRGAGLRRDPRRARRARRPGRGGARHSRQGRRCGLSVTVGAAGAYAWRRKPISPRAAGSSRWEWTPGGTEATYQPADFAYAGVTAFSGRGWAMWCSRATFPGSPTSTSRAG